jgi:histidyl-tRNA synthetase
MAKTFQKPRGTQDILPVEQKYWFFVEDTFRETMLSAGFGRILVPSIEDTSLFLRGIGEDTDIGAKELYSFKDKSDNSLSLRPEFTAGIVRAYIENGMQVEPQPVKLFTFGQVFRYDRPQAGRYREFYQANGELLGELDPTVDAQMISLVVKFYKLLGIDIVVRINSIGDAKSRPKVTKALVDFLAGHRKNLCEDCKRRMVKNPLRVLDCKEKSCQPIAEEAGGVLLDNLSKSSKEFFAKVLEYLDEMGVTYELAPRLVRGLDYYTHTTFEFVTQDGGLSLGGGGRYDELVKLLGGPATPAIGFGIGVERTIDVIKQKELPVPEPVTSDVFVIQLGDDAKKKAVKIIAQLGEAGYKVAHALGKGNISAQMKVADRMGAPFGIIIGEQEVHDNTVIIRDLKDRTQESVLDRDIIKALQRKMKEAKK